MERFHYQKKNGTVFQRSGGAASCKVGFNRTGVLHGKFILLTRRSGEEAGKKKEDRYQDIIALCFEGLAHAPATTGS